MAMPELLLHHHPISPFSEKACPVLGFKGMARRSVNSAPVNCTGTFRALPFSFKNYPSTWQNCA